MPLNPKAVRLLRKVKKHILEEPRRLNMDMWAVAKRGPACSTVGCIAGWAQLLSDPEPERFFEMAKRDLRKGTSEFRDALWNASVSPRAVAEELLDLDTEHGERLFLLQCWPRDLRVKYRAGNLAVKAKVTASRIERFIKTGGEE